MSDFRDVTFGEHLFSRIDDNVYLQKLYHNILINYSRRLFHLDEMEEQPVNIGDALTFADVLSKSCGTNLSDIHKTRAQEMVALLYDMYPKDEQVKYYLGSVLASTGNFLGMNKLTPDFENASLLERVFMHFNMDYLSVPSDGGARFFPAQKEIYDSLSRPYFSYSAPTSMGKSFMMRAFIKQQIVDGAKKNFALLIPTKALINEVRTEGQAKHYKNPDNDPRGPWFDGNPVNSPNPRPNLRYTITAPNGNIINPPANGWRWNQEELARRMATGEIRFNESGTGIIRRTYLNEQKGLPPSTLWDICEEPLWVDIEETGHTRQAKYEQKKLYPGVTTSDLFKTPKPERVIKKIYDISTEEGDIVLDFFGGSGTSAAVAHKMKRQYILCEQMDYIETFIVKRLERVVDGEDGGISKEVDWQGGGSFVYCELAKLNQTIVEEIEASTDDTTLSDIYGRMVKSGFISYKVNPADIDAAADDYAALSLNDKKRFLMEILDKNLLYVNYCDIDDEEFGISDEDKAFTRSFYREG